MEFTKEEEEKLFQELWNLIGKVNPSFAKKYPTLYKLYLRVATPKLIKQIKEKEASE